MKTFSTRFILTLAVLALTATASAGTVNYTADNTTIFPNPERGFITMLEGHLSLSHPYCIKGKESELNAHANNDKGSIILAHYYLENYRTNGNIPDSLLRAFDTDMQVLRSKGMKAIIRFSYTNSDAGDTGQDAPLAIIEKHLNKYKSHWQANADVIFCFQAGLIGAWGEWYYTENFGNKSSHINDARRALLDTLLKVVPEDRFVQIRTPQFKTEYVNSTAALTSAEAYTGTAKARLGHHNDAFLYHADNMGTYTDTATQKPYIAQETLYVPIGGESDITSSSQAAVEASHDATVAEMSRLHWTFIQSGYSTVVTDMWRQNGTFDELNRNMGYRYQLVSGTYSDQVAQGGQLSVNLQIRNVGYAPLYNERHAYIVLKNGNKTYPLQLSSDPRRWLPNNALTTISEQLTIPATVPAGTYQLYLHLPDAYASLAGDPRYAVRFANNNVWESATGMNKLNTSVTITGGQTPHEPQGDAILLPATLDKGNVSAYSDDMTWYNSTYFDFGPTDAPNTERWAEWEVELRYPGEYVVSEVGYYPNGHNYSLRLMSRQAEISLYQTEATWAEGDQTITQTEHWDLSNIATGVYTLRVQNITEWGQPKLQSLTLSYDGEIPAATTALHTDNGNTQAYDLLGRPVDDSYQGIVIMGGKKMLRMAH